MPLVRRLSACFGTIALTSILALSCADATPVQITLFAAKIWKDTGIALHAGDVVTVSAAGSWTWGPDYRVGPDGDPNDPYNAFDLFSPFDFFAQARLIGYIGMAPYQGHPGDPSFFPQTSGYLSLGSGQTFVAPYSGEFWIGFNDAAVTNSTADDKGSVVATISVGGADSTAPAIAIAAPISVYGQGQTVAASYSCSDPGDTVATCAGSVANGAAVDTSVPGPHGFSVVATDSHGNTSSQTVGYFVAGAAEADVVPVGAAFPPAYVGINGAYQSFYLTNPQSTAINISGLSATGDFAVSNTTCGASLGAHMRCRIAVLFHPTREGASNGTLDVTADVAVPGTNLRGVGTLARVFPASVDFGSQTVGVTGAPMTVKLLNSQSRNLAIAQIVSSGDFTIDPSSTCPVAGGKLGVGKGCMIAVTFTPTASDARTGTVTVVANSPIDPLAVSLTGTGTPP